ncbi:hypothetical protein VE04_01140 [Pseudogymnoascus sp. 24MN13]|nr:hypothetical protein VE04_01140 [Pseudogymnoascus sp. 24MN13]
MPRLSPADNAAAKKRAKQIQEAVYLCGTAPFSRVMMMTQEELRTLMLDLGDQRPTREPGNTMRKEVMKLQGAKFQAFCKYGSIWDHMSQHYEAINDAENRLRNSKGATPQQLESAIAVLQFYLDNSTKILNHGYDLIRMLNENEAFSLRQLVAAQGDATIHRQDRVYYQITASRATLLCCKIRAKMTKPFKCCAATAKKAAKKICRKVRRAKKKMGKKPAGALVVV